MAPMKSFERWRGARTTQHLGRQLLILYALTAAAVAGVFMSALLANWSSTTTLVATIGQSARTNEQLAQLQHLQSERAATVLTFLATGDENSLVAYQETTRQRQELLDSLLTNERLTAAQGALVQADLANIDRIAEQAIAERRGGAGEAAVERWHTFGTPQTALANAHLGELTAIQQRARESELDDARRNHLLTIGLTVIFSGAAAVLGLWITRGVILSVTRPLEALAGAAAAIGEGRLDTRVAPGLSVEFDMLGGVMNQMAAHLAESRTELQGALSATERRNRELRLLGEVGDALDSALDLDLIVARSLAIILPAFALPRGAVVIYSETGENWHWSGVADPDGAPADTYRWQEAIEALFDGQIEGEQAIRLLTVPEESAGRGLALALVPLNAAVRTYGFLVLLTPPAWCPDEQDRQLLAQFGGQLARAIENVLLYVAEKGRSAEAGMLAQMAQLTSGTLDPDRLARLIARYAVRSLGVDRCIIGFFDPSSDTTGRIKLQRLYQYGFQPPQAALVEDDPASLQAIVRQHLLDGQAIVALDARNDTRTAVLDLARGLDARSFITMPLIARDRHVGLIYLDTREPRQHAFGTQDQRILHAIADQAAAAIDGAWRYEAERRRAAQLRLLNETGQQIAAIADLPQLFAEVTGRVRDAFGYDRVRIGLIDDDELEFVADATLATFLADETDGVTARLPLSAATPQAEVARHGEPRPLVETREGRRRRVGVVVPLRGTADIVGILEAVGERPGGIDREDERTLASLGDQLGIAVERHQLQERALSLAVVEERNRLARELHDSVTQSLFSINLTLQATRLLLRRDLDATEQQLIALGERTQEALTEMRTLIHSLRPAGLEDNGLIPALKRWAERLRREQMLAVEVQVAPAARQRPEEDQERELYRIAQEALNNVVKHAAATRVVIRLAVEDDDFLMTIEDDGKGFDQDAGLRDDAFGIIGIYERAALLSGTVAIDSSPGQGTRVSVRVPRQGESALRAVRIRQTIAQLAIGSAGGPGGEA